MSPRIFPRRARRPYHLRRNTQTNGQCWAVSAEAVAAFITEHGITAPAATILRWAASPQSAGDDLEIEVALPRQGLGWFAVGAGWAVPCRACNGCFRQPCGLAEVARVAECGVCGGAGAVEAAAVREAV